VYASADFLGSYSPRLERHDTPIRACEPLHGSLEEELEERENAGLMSVNSRNERDERTTFL